MLRDVLLQECDLNDDGKPETLRLGFATPKRWLEDGKGYKLERAPSAFGRVSLRVDSHLANGEVRAEIDLPPRNPPDKISLRARVPDGWKVTSASVDGKTLVVDERGTVDLSQRKGKIVVRFEVKPD